MNVFSNPDAERGALGAWLIDANAAQSISEFRPDDFTIPEHRKLFAVLRSLQAEGTALDAVAISSRAASMGYPDADLTAAECMAFVPSAVNHGLYERMVRECSRRRVLEGYARQFVEKLADADMNPEDALEGLMHEARKGCIQNGTPDLQEAAFKILDRMNDLAKGETRAIKTGFPMLDYFTGGLFPGELTILGARPSVGKSAFALNLALNVIKQEKRVLLFSLEMTDEAWLERALAHEMGINSMDFRTGRISVEASGQIATHLNILVRHPLKIDYVHGNIEEMKRIIRKEMNENGIDLVIVDYLQLIQSRQKTASRYETVSIVSRALKQITLEFNLPVLALAQVKRPENRTVEIPLLSDLRDSGSIEQDADNVMFLHRVESEGDRAIAGNANLLAKYRKTGGNPQSGLKYVLLDVAKARNGQTGKIELYFDGAHMHFEEFAG